MALRMVSRMSLGWPSLMALADGLSDGPRMALGWPSDWVGSHMIDL